MSYNIFGTWISDAGVKVLNEYLVLGTYGAIGLAAYGATRGGGSKDKQSSGSGASAGSSSTPAILGGQDAYVCLADTATRRPSSSSSLRRLRKIASRLARCDPT